MKHFLVEIIWDDPYPKTFTYKVSGSSIATGAARAFRLFRAENKGRKIKKVTIKIQQYD